MPYNIVHILLLSEFKIFIKGLELFTTRHQPIHFPPPDKIRPLIEYFIRNSKETSSSGKLFYQWPSYFSYYKKYKRLLARLGLNEDHRPHDARKTFITRAKKKGLDEFAIKRLVGHAISDITERDVEWLRTEIEKL